MHKHEIAAVRSNAASYSTFGSQVPARVEYHAPMLAIRIKQRPILFTAWFLSSALLLASLFTCVGGLPFLVTLGAWTRHTIDDSSRGADGVRVGDVNGDDLVDLVAAWEDAGEVKVYLHPGANRITVPWPSVLVGRVGRVEDAVFVDLDEDGAIDVVSSCEGGVRTIFVHWAPSEPSRYMDSTAWQTQALPASRDARQWMFCVPMQVDGAHGVDLVAGAKEGGAQLGWFEAPANPRDLAAWVWHPIADVGWIMSILPIDVDEDGDLDVVASDRKRDGRGSFWFENPGAGPFQSLPWPRHPIGNGSAEMMFMDWADVDADGHDDAVVATSGKQLLFHRRDRASPPAWSTFSIALPEQVGTGKGVGVADIDLDGAMDLVFTCEGAGDKTGVGLLSYVLAPTDPVWLWRPISDRMGGKFDLVQLLDVDQDGDIDVVTTEEGAGLGVIWYENPIR